MYPIKTAKPYNPDALESLANIYTTVYLGNYVAGNYDEGCGSHPGVDIVPVSPMSPVFSVLDGVVERADTNASEGNFVIIRHDNVPDPKNSSVPTTLFSCYLHLSSFVVEKGQKVKEGEEIGNTGNTGQSTGEHLHFQIDRKEAPFHPYWPFTFGEAKAAGLGFFDAVNRRMGFENAERLTVNPLVYLDAVAKSPALRATSSVASVKIASSTTIAPVATKPTTPVSNITAPSAFKDVATSHSYYKAIVYLREKGIATGNAGMFRPEATVTRGELLKMAFLATGKSLSHDLTSHFSDVPVGNSFLQYVNTARENGAVSGYSDGTFRPDNSVTRSEALKMILSIFGVARDLDAPSFQVFSDVATDAWVAPFANWAKTEEALVGLNNGQFHPDAPMKRSEVASVIYTLKQ